MRLGKLLTFARVHADLTSAELAAQIGIPTKRLGVIERGGDCDFATGIKIMQWLFENEKEERVVLQERDEPVTVDPTPAAPAEVPRGVVE